MVAALGLLNAFNGQGLSSTADQLPLTFRVSMGVRFQAPAPSPAGAPARRRGLPFSGIRIAQENEAQSQGDMIGGGGRT